MGKLSLRLRHRDAYLLKIFIKGECVDITKSKFSGELQCEKDSLFTQHLCHVKQLLLFEVSEEVST